MGKTSIDNFIKIYTINSKAKDKTFEDFIKKHITTEYIDFMTKCVYCDSIVKSTCYVKDGDKEFVKINSANRYLFFVMRLLQLYTDLDINNKNPLDDYDKLNKVGAIETLIAAIPESEYTEFSTLLNMKMDDFKDNEYSITALLYNLKQSFSLSAEVITEALKSPEIKKFIKELQSKEN